METTARPCIRITSAPAFGLDRQWIALRVGECFAIENPKEGDTHYQLRKFHIRIDKSNAVIEPNPIFTLPYEFSPDADIENHCQIAYRDTQSSVGYHESTNKREFLSTAKLAIKKTSTRMEHLIGQLRTSKAYAEEDAAQARKMVQPTT
jgi:hypothetical protein